MSKRKQRTLITKELESNIVKDYLSGISCLQIAKKYNIGSVTPWLIVKRNNIKIRSKNLLTPEQEQEVIKYYQTGLSCLKISKLFNITSNIVLDCLRKHNIPRHKNIKFKYNPNESFFDDLNKEDVLWVLGWLYSDGYNGEHIGRITLTTHTKDTEVLKKINLLLDGKLQEKNVTAKSVLYIYSKILSRRLSDLGCVRAKSLIVKYPQWIQNEFQARHFIRGIIEGDGWISIRKGHVRGCSCGISSGSKIFLEKLKVDIEKYLNIRVSLYSYPNKKNNHTIRIGEGTYETLKFLDWIYDCKHECVLNRKYNNYLKFKNRLLNFQAIDPNRNRYKQAYFISPDGKIYNIFGIRQFCREFNLGLSPLLGMIKGKPSYYQHKGWRLCSPVPWLDNSEIIKKHY